MEIVEIEFRLWINSDWCRQKRNCNCGAVLQIGQRTANAVLGWDLWGGKVSWNEGPLRTTNSFILRSRWIIPSKNPRAINGRDVAQDRIGDAEEVVDNLPLGIKNLQGNGKILETGLISVRNLQASQESSAGHHRILINLHFNCCADSSFSTQRLIQTPAQAEGCIFKILISLGCQDLSEGVNLLRKRIQNIKREEIWILAWL